MIWTQLSAYCLRSEDGAYTVAKIGGDRGFTYEPWFGKENLAVGYLDAEAAKGHCEAHATRAHADLCASVMERTL